MMAAVAHFAGFLLFYPSRILGFRFAPPQALCLHPLRGFNDSPNTLRFNRRKDHD
jgi:hypothetical protein